MNLKFKYDTGGAFIPPYAVYQPLEVTSPTTETSSKESSEKSKSNALLDSIYKTIGSLEGLPGDTLAASKMMALLIDRINLKLNHPGLSNGIFSTSEITTDYLKVMNIIKNIKYHKEQYDEAKKLSEQNGGVHEAAIDSLGRVIVFGKDGFDWKYPEQIDPKLERVITNSELLNYRANGVGGLAFNDSVLHVVSNSIGIDEVTKSILDCIKKIGSNSSSYDSYTLEAITTTLEGIQAFVDSLKELHNGQADNEYRNTLMSENQEALFLFAKRYIFKLLSNTALSLLKLKSDGTIEGALGMIEDLLRVNLSSKYKYGFDKSKSSKDALKEDFVVTKSSKDALKEDFVVSFQSGRGGHETPFTIMSGKDDKGFTVNAVSFEEMKKLDGKHLYEAPIDIALNNTGLRSIIDSSENIYFGDNKIDKKDLEHILYDGTNIAHATLPVDEYGNLNFDMLKEYKQAVTIFKRAREEAKSRNLDPNKITIEDVIKDNNFRTLEGLKDINGKLNSDRFRNFILINGITFDSLVPDVKNRIDKKVSKFIKVIDHDSRIASEFEKVMITENENLRDDTSIDPKSWGDSFLVWKWLSGGYDKIYKGTLFIPINMSKSAAALGGNQKISVEESKKLEEEFQNSGHYVLTNLSILL